MEAGAIVYCNIIDLTILLKNKQATIVTWKSPDIYCTTRNVYEESKKRMSWNIEWTAEYRGGEG